MRQVLFISLLSIKKWNNAVPSEQSTENDLTTTAWQLKWDNYSPPNEIKEMSHC